jgi:hypothetical protein
MRAAALLAALVLFGCRSGQVGAGGPGSSAGPEDGAAFEVADLSATEARAYLQKVALPLVGRVLTAEENARVDEDGGAAIEPIVAGWAKEPALAAGARTMMEEKLSVSGLGAEVDYSLPGNLVEHVVSNDLPWSEVLTATSCYDAAGAPIACDTGAPFAAGVLTTRGYLKSRSSRFNLTRSSTLMRAFACQIYPQADDLQPRVPPEELRGLFAITDLSQASEEDLAAAANPEFPCHMCHGQFAAHTQLFVKFDQEGNYRSDATGEQDPEGELGRSFGGLMTSHFINPARAADERSQLFGTEVANLAEAASVLADHPVFVQCAAQNVLEYALRIDTAGPLGKAVSPEMLERIAMTAEEAGPNPSFGQIVHATLSDVDVVRTTLLAIGGFDEKP